MTLGAAGPRSDLTFLDQNSCCLHDFPDAVRLEMLSLPTVVDLNDVIHDDQGYSQPALLSLHSEITSTCKSDVLSAVLSFNLF